MTDIYLMLLFSFLGGLLIGWYPTFTHYRAKERERKAVEAYKAHQWVKKPPITDWQEAINIIAKLNDSIVEEYHIVLEGEIYEMRPIEKQEKEEEL